MLTYLFYTRIFISNSETPAPLYNFNPFSRQEATKWYSLKLQLSAIDSRISQVAWRETVHCEEINAKKYWKNRSENLSMHQNKNLTDFESSIELVYNISRKFFSFSTSKEPEITKCHLSWHKYTIAIHAWFFDAICDLIINLWVVILNPFRREEERDKNIYFYQLQTLPMYVYFYDEMPQWVEPWLDWCNYWTNFIICK